MIKNLIKNLFSKAEAEASAAEQNANTYTDTAIDTQTTYSTTEQAVGTWIDGKTVYRRSFTGTLNNATSTVVTNDSSVLLPNVTPIKLDGILLSRTNNTSINIGSYLNAQHYCGVWWTNNAVTIYNASNNNGWEYVLTIYYAK